MLQQWVTVIGLGLDFAGFALLLREWWLAFFDEGVQLQMEEALERQRALRQLGRSNRDPAKPNPFETLERVQDDAAIRKAREAHRGARRSRQTVFVTAAVMIVLGFVLQIIGALPGCCPPWIVPQT
ncbi:MAG: hypothetical protein ACT4N2_13210 [Hyphomicrobium sp.]